MPAKPEDKIMKKLGRVPPEAAFGTLLGSVVSVLWMAGVTKAEAVALMRLAYDKAEAAGSAGDAVGSLLKQGRRFLRGSGREE